MNCRFIKIILTISICLIFQISCIFNDKKIFQEQKLENSDAGRDEYAADDPDAITIGVFFELSGSGAQTGTAGKRGVEIAVDKANKNKILPKKIRIIEFDNKSAETGAEEACRKILEKKPLAVIGPSWSGMALACAPKLQKAGILMITTLATNPDVTKSGDYIFRACFTDDVQGKYMAIFARKQLNFNRVLIFKDISSPYSMMLSDAFRKTFMELNGSIVEVEFSKNQTENEQREIIKKAAKLNSQAIYIPNYNKISGPIAKMARQEGIKAVFLGSDGWGTDKEMFFTGGKYILDSFVTAHWHFTQTDEKSLDFMFRFSDKYFEVPDQASALGYDAANMLIDAIKISGSENREKIRNALRNNAFEGVTGRIRYGKTGDPVKSGIIVITVPFGSTFRQRVYDR